jgi:hypothetical protein
MAVFLSSGIDVQWADKGTPSIFSITIYSAPTEFSLALELEAKTLGEGVLQTSRANFGNHNQKKRKFEDEGSKRLTKSIVANSLAVVK